MSVRQNRARGYCMAPMEAGMGMSCWILLVFEFVIVKPVEGKVSFWDHQTPGGNHAWGSNGEGLRALGALGTRETVEGPCATGRFRRHLDGFRHFTVHVNHNEVYICVCEAKL